MAKLLAKPVLYRHHSLRQCASRQATRRPLRPRPDDHNRSRRGALSCHTGSVLSYWCSRRLCTWVDLIFSTIYGNTVRTDATGADIEIKVEYPTQLSQVRIRNSIIVGAPAHSGPDISRMLSSYGYNLFQNNSGATFDPSTRTQHSTDKTLLVNEVTRVFASSVRPRDNGGPSKSLFWKSDKTPSWAVLSDVICEEGRSMLFPAG